MPPKKARGKHADAAAPSTAAQVELQQRMARAAEELQQYERAFNFKYAPVSPILDKPTLVTLKDGRQLMGPLACFDSHGNLIITPAVERRQMSGAAPSVLERFVPTIAIPSVEVESFMQRDNFPEELLAAFPDGAGLREYLNERAKHQQNFDELRVAAAGGPQAIASSSESQDTSAGGGAASSGGNVADVAQTDPLQNVVD